jgi:hypothetical protein
MNVEMALAIDRFQRRLTSALITERSRDRFELQEVTVTRGTGKDLQVRPA